MSWTVSLILAGVIGLVVGSFLNVAIARYPDILMRRWRKECREFLELPGPPPTATLNLATPGSQCPRCGKRLRIWHNIPLISYLMLRGRCGFCQQRISPQYPLVELITAVLTLAVFWQYGWSWQALAAGVLTWGLVALAGIDWKVHLLPDDITLTLLWMGLLVNTSGAFASLGQAVWGAAAGYALLWVVAKLFQWVRKKSGMGHGDFKMLAMLGAWLGGAAVLNALVLAVLMSLALNLILLAFKKIRHDQPLPFGPWLAIAGWLTLIFQPMVNVWLSR